jgi:ABC-type microcin C transport system permease subunit YejB
MGWKPDNTLGTWTVLAVLFGLVLLILFALVAFLSLFAIRG